MRRLILGVLLMSCGVPPALAQSITTESYPKFEVFGGYLDSGEFPYNVFHFGKSTTLESDFGTHHGLEASLIRNLNRYFGLKGDFSAHFHHDHGPVNVCLQAPCSPMTQTADLNPKLFNFLGGPEIKKPNHTPFPPLPHPLFPLPHTRLPPSAVAWCGAATTQAIFKTAGSVINLSRKTSEPGFALAFGGGLDLHLPRRFSFRTSLDYNPKWVGRDENGLRQSQNDLRL